MSDRNFYQVLGVRTDATQRDIRAAFVRLTRLHHPDSAGDQSALAWRIRDVQQAYHCLSVPGTRAAHDAALAEAERRHFMRQRAAQRRLQRYDHRHPHAQPRRPWRERWRELLLTLPGAAASVWMLISRRSR